MDNLLIQLIFHRLISYDINGPGADQILLKTLAAPINPADINQLEGVYPSIPPFTTNFTDTPHAIGGNEGVFEVIEVGSNVKGFKPGDWTIPSFSNFGTWRTHALASPDQLIPIKRDGITELQAATIFVNPCTAHQMLTRFVSLKKGDWFIQNGGNSGVGRSAIQLGKIWGLNSISVVRNRENLDELVKELTDIGATKVITDEQLNNKAFKSTIKEWTQGNPIKLGLNGIGGKAATGVARQLGNGGKLVTYGGMSKQPVTFPTSLFIFKDISAHGFWLTEYTNNHPESKKVAIDEILDYIREGKFKDVPTNTNTWSISSSDEVKFGAFQQALENATRGFSGKKQVIAFSD